MSDKEVRHESISINFWYQENDKSIHITSSDAPGFHTTVTKKTTSALRYHPNLFDKLAKILESKGKYTERDN